MRVVLELGGRVGRCVDVARAREYTRVRTRVARDACGDARGPCASRAARLHIARAAGAMSTKPTTNEWTGNAPLWPGTGGAWSCWFSKVTLAGAFGSPSTCFLAGQFADVHR